MNTSSCVCWDMWIFLVTRNSCCGLASGSFDVIPQVQNVSHIYKTNFFFFYLSHFMNRLFSWFILVVLVNNHCGKLRHIYVVTHGNSCFFFFFISKSILWWIIFSFYYVAKTVIQFLGIYYYDCFFFFFIIMMVDSFMMCP